MFTVLSAAVGFFGSWMPSIISYFQDKQDKKHELLVLEVQMKMQEAGHVQKLEEINVMGDIKEMQSLHRHDKMTGVAFIDGLRGSVRPVITYIFFSLFVFVEVTAYIALTAAGVDSMAALGTVWSSDVMSLFTAVMAFWFGNRSLEKYRSRS
jgi:hypothetical protein